MASVGLAHDFVHERGRWPGVPVWEDELAALGFAIESRASELAALFGMDMPLVLAPVPATIGRLYVNGQPVAEHEVWQGWYAPGASVEVVAVPAAGFVAAGWDGVAGRDVPGSGAALTIAEPVTLTARFASIVAGQGPRKPQTDDVVINELWINDDGTRYGSLGWLPLDGDWVELRVRAPGGADLSGWRLTDNDTKRGDAEGSLIFPSLDALSSVPCGTVILIVATQSPANATTFPMDDLDARDGKMMLYAGNGTLDSWTDPGFALGTGDDALALLAPGETPAPGDDVGIDFVAEGREVTPWTFGVLADGVTFDTPFDRLGADDGAAFSGTAGNDALGDWIVDPPACASEEAQCYGVRTVVTPGALNPGQAGYRVGCFIQRLKRP